MTLQVSSVYAKAVFEFAQEQKRAEQSLSHWGEFLAHAAAVFSEESVIRALTLGMVTGQELVDDLEKFIHPDATTKKNAAMQHFLLLLADKKRLLELHSILKAFNRLCAEADQSAQAIVYAAVPLTKAQIKTLSDQLAKRENKTISIQQESAPELLGGFLVKIGDKVIDRSLRCSLTQLQKHMLG